MLMTFSESGDQQETEVSVLHVNAAQEMMERALDGGGFEQAVQKHINKTGMMPEPSAAITADGMNRQVKTTLMTEAEWQLILDNRAAASGATVAAASGATNANHSTNTMEVAVGDGSAAPIGIGGIDAVLQHAG
jgi:pyruvate/2-oxoacid:ferredoxin oxidoreductase beta subunit